MTVAASISETYLEGMRSAAANDFDAAVERFWSAQAESADDAFKALCALRASQALRNLQRERDANEWLLRAEHLAIAAEAHDLLVNIGHTWAARGNASRATNALRAVLDGERFKADADATRLRALASYELAKLAIEHGARDAAERYLQDCDALQVDEVAPYALLTYATKLAGRLVPIERELVLQRAVDYDHPDASPRAAVELGRFYLRHLAVRPARDYLTRALRSKHADAARAAQQLLESLDERDGERGGFARDCDEPTPAGHRRVLVCGAGTGAQDYSHSVSDKPVHIVGYLDDEHEWLRAHGAPVFGELADLERVIAELDADDVVFAIPSAPGVVRKAAFDASMRAGVPMHDVPSMHTLDERVPVGLQLEHPTSIDALIGSQPRIVDREAAMWLRNARVLIAGAGCALGVELCRRAAKARATRVAAVDNSTTQRAELQRAVDRAGLFQVQALPDTPERERFDTVFIVVEPASDSDGEVVYDFDSMRLLAQRHMEHGARVILVEPYVPDPDIAQRQREVEYDALGELGGGPEGTIGAVRVSETLRGHHGPLTQMEADAAQGAEIVLRGPGQRRLLTVERACELVLRAARNVADGQTIITDAGEELSLGSIADLVSQRYERLGGVKPPLVVVPQRRVALLQDGETKQPSMCCPELAVVKRSDHVLSAAAEGRTARGPATPG